MHVALLKSSQRCGTTCAVSGSLESDPSESGTPWAEVSILDDPILADRFAEQIPVVLVDGEVHDFWHVDAERLRGALARPSAT